MDAFRRFLSVLRNLFHGRRVERELDAELRGYLDLLTDEKIASGMTLERARREARIELGGVEQVKEEVRAVRAGALLEQLTHDVRYTLRGLRHAPVFAVTVIVTLALGIGANTAIFSIIDALLLRPLAVADPDRLVAVYRGAGASDGAFSYATVERLAAQQNVFSGVSAWAVSSSWLRGAGDAERVSVHTVSPGYFDVLGVRPELGGGFPRASEEASYGAAIISDHFWRVGLGTDPGVVGRAISLGGQPVTIIGVAPRGFGGLDPSSPADVWVTLPTVAALQPGWDFRDPQEIWLQVIARLRDDVGARAAEGAIQAALPAGASVPAPLAGALRLVPAATPIFDPSARASSSKLAMLVAAVAFFVLVVACANVANLLLVRSGARRREVAVRLAVGASRARLARQMITESLVLGAAGCLAGLTVAYWTLRGVVALAPASAIPPGISVSLDGRIVIFAVLLSVLTALVFGAGPAWQASQVDLLPVIKGSQEDHGLGRGAMGLRRGLVITQVALSAVLLVGAALFLRTLGNALSVEPGYDVRHVLLATVDFTAAKLSPPAAQAAGDRVLERLRAAPGVSGAALGQIVPFSGSFVSRPAVPDGQTMTGENEAEFMTPYAVVSDGYFHALGMPVRGRDFTAGDTEEAPRVAVINESLARKFWPGQSALGKRVTLPLREPGPSYEVVGIVPDGKYVTLMEAQHPYLYVPWKQMHRARMTLHVRTAGSPLEAEPAVREAIREAGGLPAYNILPLSSYLDRSLAQQRVVARLLLVFGGIALTLAAVGVYGLTAYTVTRRAKELGVRIALGARPADLIRMLMFQHGLLIAAGLAIGGVAALLVSGLVKSMLFGVTPSDPLSFAAGALVLSVTMLAATLIPARRAARADPLSALRVD